MAVIGALLVACSDAAEDGSVEAANEPALADIEDVDEEPDAEPESGHEPEPDLVPADEPVEAKPDPDVAAEPEAGKYDGYPIDQPVEDVSVIDEAYVEEVLRVLDENYVEVVRAVQEIGVENIDTDAYAQSIAAPVARAFAETYEVVGFERVLAFAEQGGFQTRPSAVESSVTRLLTVSARCIGAEVHRDVEGLFAAPFNGTWYVAVEQRSAMTVAAGSVWRYSVEEPGTGEILDGCE